MPGLPTNNLMVTIVSRRDTFLDEIHNIGKEIISPLRIPVTPFSENQPVSVFPIIKPDQTGRIIKTIKEETVESVSLPRVYDLLRGGIINLETPKIDLLKYNNSVVFPASDFILTHEGAVWEKFFEIQFTKMIPKDRNFEKYEGGKLFVRNPKRIVPVKNGFSLCGVYESIWAHFLVQHLPRLLLLAEYRNLLEGDITIILPHYDDPQVKEIVYSFLDRMEGVNVLELKSDEAAVCESLFYIGKTAAICDHANYCAFSDVVIPKLVPHLLKKYLSNNPFLRGKSEQVGNNNKGVKLFIGRNNSSRVLINNDEIEAYFHNKGYITTFPHLLSLQEKIELFNSASCVVGVASSGFTNVVFSRPYTKVLVFTNFQRSFDPYGGFLSEGFGINYNLMTGIDAVSHDINSSYYIPMERVVRACKELGL